MKANKQFTSPVIKREEGSSHKINVQKKVKIGKSNDKSECEADNVADRVMRMPENEEETVNMQPQEDEEKVSQISKQTETEEEDTSTISMQPEEEKEDEISMQLEEEEETSLQKQDEDEDKVNMQAEEGEEEEEPIQTKEESSIAKVTENKDEEINQKSASSNPVRERYASSKIVNQINDTKSGGQPLPEKTNRELSGKMGRDFSNVKIHTDSRAVKMNKDLKAKAFTYKNHIYFNRGQFAPDNTAGKKLLAHELAHVVQQKSSLIQRQTPKKIPYITVEGQKKLNELDDTKYYSNSGLSNLRIKKTSSTSIKIMFVNSLEGKPDIILPHIPGFEIKYLNFGTDSLHVNLEEIKNEPMKKDGSGISIPSMSLDNKIIFFNAFNNGGIDEKHFKGFGEVMAHLPSETKKTHATGLKTEMTSEKVIYSMKGGKIAVVYSRNSNQITVNKANNSDHVLFNSAKSGFIGVVDIKLDINGIGEIILKKEDNIHKKIQIDLKSDFNPTETTIDNQEFVQHDELVKKLKKQYNVKTKEEARLIPVNALSKLYDLISSLSDQAKQLLISATAKKDFVIEHTVARDFSETKLLLGGNVLIGGQLDVGKVDVALIHEFTHYLYDTLGLSTKDITEEDIEKQEYSELSAQVEKVKTDKKLKTKKQAINVLSTDTELNNIWLGMFKPLDEGSIEGFNRPENARIIDLCDEGNYNLVSYLDAGHPFDNVNEFIASMVTTVNFSREAFIKAVKEAKSGDKDISIYYKKAWNIICAKGIELGSNPF